MQYIAHRINTVEQLEQVPNQYGIELDLRDFGDRIVMQHDPFVTGQVQDFEDLLSVYDHGTMILNVKSERIEHRVLELLQRYAWEDYFFLDSSFPMIRTLVSNGESRIAVRFSEFEPLESALSVAGQVDWVWVDCFTRMPLTPSSYDQLAEHFRLCVVSPELQGRDVSEIIEFAGQLRPYPVDAVCTKRPDLWQAAIGREAA